MGHDIYAKMPGVDEEKLRKQYRLNEHDDEWLDRYDQFDRAAYVAYNRRSAGNPLNQVIYLALGVMDEAYAGCSGNGETIEIDLDQFKDAKRILHNKTFHGMKRDRNLSDDILEMLAGKCGDENVVVNIGLGDSGDVSQEVEFVDKCISYLEQSGRRSLMVYFG